MLFKETENAQRLLYSLAEESCLLLPPTTTAALMINNNTSSELNSPSFVVVSDCQQQQQIDSNCQEASSSSTTANHQADSSSTNWNNCCSILPSFPPSAPPSTASSIFNLQLQHNVQRTAAVNRRLENLWPAPARGTDRLEQSALFHGSATTDKAALGAALGNRDAIPPEELLTWGLLREIERIPGGASLKPETKLLVARSCWEMQQRILATSSSVSMAVAGRGVCRKMCWKSIVNAARYSRVPEAVIMRAEARLARYCSRVNGNK